MVEATLVVNCYCHIHCIIGAVTCGMLPYSLLVVPLSRIASKAHLLNARLIEMVSPFDLEGGFSKCKIAFRGAWACDERTLTSLWHHVRLSHTPSCKT